MNATSLNLCEGNKTRQSTNMADCADSSSDTDSTCDNRLGTCVVCGENPAKYTCPRCEVRSCSLTCVKKHKNETGCSGERDKTAFKRLSEFTNLDLLSDYRMLEETTRSIENYKRDPLKYFTRWNRSLPMHLNRLREAVALRGCKLLILPQNFIRHKNNSTYFDWKTQKISWRIEWVFPQAGFIKVVDERAPEDTHVSTLIKKYLDYKSCPKDVQEKLQFYQSAGLLDICLLLKAEHVRKSSTKFYEIDPSLPLKSALKNKTIIEFPSIFVVHKDHKEMFEIVGSDDEEEEENESSHYREFYSKRINTHQRNHRIQKRGKQKNFLFNESDGSDSSEDCSPPKQSMNTKGKMEVKNEPGFNIPSYHELIQQNQ